MDNFWNTQRFIIVVGIVRSNEYMRFLRLNMASLGHLHIILLDETLMGTIRMQSFVEIGQQIVANSPFSHTLFSGNSNGAFGYIPTREAFLEGGYETLNTAFEPGAAESLAEQGVNLLREMKSADLSTSLDVIA